MPLLAGTSGWQYRDWRDAFYPADVPLSRWLDHYATTFPTVENNGTFYRLAKPETFAGWRARTPDGFLMAVKASRYLTHIRRLRDPAEPVGRLLTAGGWSRRPARPGAAPAAADHAGGPRRPGPVPGGVPGSRRRRPPGLRDRALRVCVEFRHESWWTPDVRQLLDAAQRGAVLGGSPRPAARRRSGGPPTGATCGCTREARRPWPRYGRQALATWLSRIRGHLAAERGRVRLLQQRPARRGPGRRAGARQPGSRAEPVAPAAADRGAFTGRATAARSTRAEGAAAARVRDLAAASAASERPPARPHPDPAEQRHQRGHQQRPALPRCRSRCPPPSRPRPHGTAAAGSSPAARSWTASVMPATVIARDACEAATAIASRSGRRLASSQIRPTTNTL